MRIFCFIFLIFNLSVTYAQKATLTDASEFNIRRDDFYILGKWKNWTAVYLRNGNEYKLICFDQQGHKVKQFILNELQDECEEVRLTPSGESISISWEKIEQKKKTVYVSRIDENGRMQPAREVFSVPHGNFRRINLQYGVSPDKNYQVVFCESREDDMHVLKACILDAGMGVKKNVEQKISEKDFTLTEKVFISNSGHVYLLASETPNQKGAMEGLRLLSCKNAEQSFVSYEIPLNKHHVSQVQLCQDSPNANLYICGYYGDGKYSSPKGLFFSVFNEDQQAPTVSHFTPVAMQVTGYKADLRDMKIKHVSIKQDGGVELAAERTYQNIRTLVSQNPAMTTAMAPMPESTRSVNEFYYDEIAVFNLKLDGTLLWNQIILKEQMTTEDAGIYSSFGLMEYPKGKIFVFNDFSSKKSRLIAAYLSAKGDHQMKELPVSNVDSDWDLLPRSSIQTGKTEIWIPALQKGYICFLKLAY